MTKLGFRFSYLSMNVLASVTWLGSPNESIKMQIDFFLIKLFHWGPGKSKCCCPDLVTFYTLFALMQIHRQGREKWRIWTTVFICIWTKLFMIFLWKKNEVLSPLLGHRYTGSLWPIYFNRVRFWPVPIHIHSHIRDSLPPHTCTHTYTYMHLLFCAGALWSALG